MSARFRFGTKSLAIAVCWMMMATVDAQAPAVPTQLNLVIVRGDGAANDVRQPNGNEPVVRVEDENHKPVSGAAVAFTLPTEGASGEFSNHSKTMTVITDSNGEAAAKGLRPNQVLGKVPLFINASYRGLTTRGSMMRFNLTGGGGHHSGGKIALVVLLVAGAAAGGAVVAMRGKSTTATTATVPVPIGLTPATGTVGTPAH